MLDLARRLPEWFTPGGLEHMALDFQFQHRRVAVALAGEVVGFLTFNVHEGEGQICWLGVAPEHQRQGVGRALLTEIEHELRTAGVRAVTVETLGDAVDYDPYEKTRAFYRSMGYRDAKVLQLDNPECPELLTLRKEL